MKESMTRLWCMTLLVAAYFCAFIASVIGIPGRILHDASNGLYFVYNWLISTGDRLYDRINPETDEGADLEYT